MLKTTSFPKPRALLAAVLSLAAIGAVQAQAPLPAMEQQGPVRFACGGIGQDESSAMRAAMKSHPLSLLFARTSGEYLANVMVDVRDAKGSTVLSTTAGGPVCLLDLPPGKYTVTAVAGSASKSQTVTVDAKPRTADFRF